jgi:hypothetical protein
MTLGSQSTINFGATLLAYLGEARTLYTKRKSSQAPAQIDDTSVEQTQEHRDAERIISLVRMARNADASAFDRHHQSASLH